jgi:hypothetical protein
MSAQQPPQVVTVQPGTVAVGGCPTCGVRHMSRAMTKPTLCVCDQHGFRPACASAQSDQDPCCSLTNSIASRETDSEQHGS